MFLFRKQFAAQAALTSLFSYLFSCMASTPHRFVFARASGAIYLQDMAVHYTKDVKARNADMPYRMTRNLSSFISQYGIEGWFLVTQALAAQSMTGTKQNLKWALHLFFRCASSATLLQCPHRPGSCTGAISFFFPGRQFRSVVVC